MLRHFVLVISALVCAVDSIGAQVTADASVGLSSTAQEEIRPRSPAVVAVASAILPGSGQALMRQKRSLVYFALEAAGVAYYVSQHREGDRERDRYRQLARSVARAEFSPDGPAGSWDYYESMEKYVASGAYDVIAGGNIDPEANEETFNGATWLLARQTYWRDPNSPPPVESAEYAAALDFYKSRAVQPDYRWSWLADPDAFRQFRRSIASSNSAFRNAEQTVSLVLANHVLSAVDAYASLRLRIRRSSDGAMAVVASVPF
jgi:hypothetical protein